ncbi:MAG: alpha-E domain-containing protein [Verrucomicrobiota bacterium]
MLSRVAHLVYWMARYLERAENTARIVDVNDQLVVDLQSRRDADDPKAWEPLVFVSGSDEKFHELYGETATERSVVDFMLFDRRNPSSVVSCVCAARENARCIRDQLSSEVWETLNTFYLRLKDDDYSRYAQVGSSEYLFGIKTQLQLFFGVAESMIPRNDGWWFFELGRHLERADNTSRIIDVKYFMILPDLQAVGSALDVVQWASVLRSCSAYEAFRRSRRGELNLHRAVDYLVRDELFPRSILFSVAEAEQSLVRISNGMQGSAVDKANRLAAGLRAQLEGTDIRAAIANGLHEFLDHIQERIQAIDDAIFLAFIAYPVTPARVIEQTQTQ